MKMFPIVKDCKVLSPYTKLCVQILLCLLTLDAMAGLN